MATRRKKTAAPLKAEEGQELPLLPLKDLVVFPNQILPLFVGRPRSIAAVEEASRGRHPLVLVTQRNPLVEDPGADGVYATGVAAEIVQVLRLPDGMRLIVEGKRRAILEGVRDGSDTLRANVRLVDEDERGPANQEEEASLRSLLDLFEEYVRLHPKLPLETVQALSGVDAMGRLADVVAAHLTLRPSLKQAFLDERDPRLRVEAVSKALSAENQVLALERQINGRVRKRMEKHQREAWLQEQLRAIQQELGAKNEDVSEAVELKERLAARKLPKEVKERALKELGRFERMAPLSAEATVIRTYLDWILALPWNRPAKSAVDLDKAREVLDADHEGLEKPKTRVLEFLAVHKLKGDLKGPILCLVGPPGVGKTSLARSVARALGRKFERVSLGGVRDEAEIRGHRRTYIGAMPGRIVQALKRAGSSNPVILLDELDKMAADFRGDPASALLEVLDPEQNAAFNDHYMDLPLDLSQVLFLCTGNDLGGIPGPLRDRLELLEIPGYLEGEKLGIARRFLLPRQLEAHGLKPGQVELPDATILRLVRDYTREAGVRELDRQVAALCRKAARAVVVGGPKTVFTADPSSLEGHLGVPRFARDESERRPSVGLATGLAWTPFGGETLAIEVSLAPGKGSLLITGQLGEVMKESAQAALSYLRAHSAELGLKPDFPSKTDIHIHVPEGATPKDGPSAGITICTALASAFTGRPVRHDLAMTGEITLRGRVLPIGGLKEKSLAARREGVTTLIVPRSNRKDLSEVPEEARRALKWHLVSSMDQVLKLALLPKKASERQRLAAERAVPAAEEWREHGPRQ
jgi:ATP-dependent Lon protease